jgi:hypothetical protein
MYLPPFDRGPRHDSAEPSYTLTTVNLQPDYKIDAMLDR